MVQANISRRKGTAQQASTSAQRALSAAHCTVLTYKHCCAVLLLLPCTAGACAPGATHMVCASIP
jgi:hypothetical protein